MTLASRIFSPRRTFYHGVCAFTFGVSLVTPAIAQRQVVTGPGSSSSRTAAADALLKAPITITLDHVSLAIAVDRIAATAGVVVFYQRELLEKSTQPVTVRAVAIPLGELFARVLDRTALQLVPLPDAQFSIAPVDATHLARFDGIVTGKAIDGKTKQPLQGATVTLDDATRGVATGPDGVFRFTNIPAGVHTIAIRLIGYTRQTRSVTITDGQTLAADFSLDSRATALDQVVVTGTVIPTELKAVPSAITIITAKEIQQRGITHIDQLFRGDVPGLFASNTGSSNPLDTVVMFSRGQTNLSRNSYNGLATSPIKTYVDGVELTSAAYMSQIDPRSIERIEILTGPQASTIYGSNAINGVMQIFTKRGTTNRPQFTAALMSGFVQNSFSSALTPQHDYSALVNGVEGNISYNVGGGWTYMGPWTPAKQTATLNGFGGARMQRGAFTIDGSLRLSNTVSKQNGAQSQIFNGYRETGLYAPSPSANISAPTRYMLNGQTLGMTLGYAPVSWWSHELVIGRDGALSESRNTGIGLTSRSDTLLYLYQTQSSRLSLRYATTMRASVTPYGQLTVTGGLDGWQSLANTFSDGATVLTGTLNSTLATASRMPGHNTGAFVQAQLGVRDALFFTYGLRAEWNPNYGSEAEPNLAPRYGMAYTRDVGPITAKLRASYGRSTQPPTVGQKTAVSAAASSFFAPTASILALYGNFNPILANADLQPSSQQGIEGGLELYFGTRASLVLTRYNQTVDNLILNVYDVDSARSLQPLPAGLTTDYYSSLDAAGYGYQAQRQNLNVGSIRNQGWEAQGSVTFGQLTTRGTYSFTKSRMLGITPKYRSFFTMDSYPGLQAGAVFGDAPEHTWALGFLYSTGATSIDVNLTGTGTLYQDRDSLFYTSLTSSVRLTASKARASDSRAYNQYPVIGYVLADLNASQHISQRIDGVFQVQNLSNHYQNDYLFVYPVMGRQTKLGLRLRW